MSETQQQQHKPDPAILAAIKQYESAGAALAGDGIAVSQPGGDHPLGVLIVRMSDFFASASGVPMFAIPKEEAQEWCMDFEAAARHYGWTMPEMGPGVTLAMSTAMMVGPRAVLAYQLVKISKQEKKEAANDDQREHQAPEQSRDVSSNVGHGQDAHAETESDDEDAIPRSMGPE